MDRYTRGMDLYRQGQWQEAAAVLGPLGGRADATGRMARFYEGMSYRAMGGEALGRGEFDLAAACFRAAMAAMGRDASLSAYLARIYARTGRHEACAKQMEAVIDRDGADVASIRRLALAQWQAGRRVEAYMTLWQGLHRFGGASDLHVQMGLFHAAEEQYEQAKEHFLAALGNDEGRADAHRYLALAQAAEGKPEEAVVSFQRAFELSPHDLMLALQLSLSAKAAAQKGLTVRIHLPRCDATEDARSLPALARNVLAEEDFVEALLALPAAAMDGELFTTLRQAIRAALQARPGYADLRLQASRVCARLGLMDEAVCEGRLATQINPEYAAALVHLGRLQADRGRRNEAIRCLRRAIRCGADWADVHCLAGELLAQAGRTTGARKHLRRALDLNGTYARAAEALASLAA